MNPDGSILLYEGTEGVAVQTRAATGSPLTHAALLCYPALWDVQIKRWGPFGVSSRPRKLLPVGKLLLPSVRLKIMRVDCRKLSARLEQENCHKQFHPFGALWMQTAYRLQPGWPMPWSCAEWIIRLLWDVGIQLFPGEESRMHAPHDFLRSTALMRLP